MGASRGGSWAINQSGLRADRCTVGRAVDVEALASPYPRIHLHILDCTPRALHLLCVHCTVRLSYSLVFAAKTFIFYATILIFAAPSSFRHVSAPNATPHASRGPFPAARQAAELTIDHMRLHRLGQVSEITKAADVFNLSNEKDQ